MSELKKQIEKRFKELRDDCALQRLHVRNAFKGRWSGCPRKDPDNPSSWDLHWENLQSEAQIQRPKDVEAADKRLADFVVESRLIMGANWPGTDHGRLCWSPYCGGSPIGQYYCQLEEGHSEHHVGTDAWGEEACWPNSQLQEVTNDYEWQKLVSICKHEITFLKSSVPICVACGKTVTAIPHNEPV